MAELKILSFNVQGLGGIKKQKDVFNYLQNKNFDIVCLQDTHFTSDQEKHIRNRWEGSCFFSAAPQSNARGVAIFFGKKVDYKIHNQKQDENGNLLILDLTISNKRLSLINVYGPNKDDPTFYENVFKSIADIGNELYIICGDFNLTLNPNIDCFNYKHINNPKARNFITNMKKENNLFDTFRELHPYLKRYTWRRKTPLKQSRLDFFLVTENIVNSIKKSQIETGYKSDHSMVTLILAMDNFEHGKSLWKHNNSLLTDTEYLKTINSKIQDIKKQYCLPVYNHEAIDEIPDEELQFVINDQLFLDTVMMEIRGKSISYASYKKKSKNIQEQKLVEQIQYLEDNLSENKIPNLEKSKLELGKLREEKMKGFLIRSRANDIENGEKPSQFFCSLETNNFKSKVINVIEKDDGEIITDQKQILAETCKFYETLYASKENTLNDVDLNAYMQDMNVPKLHEDEALKLEGILTLKEAGKTLKNMKNNKSPGTSGFSADFYKVFWKQLGTFVVRAINFGFLKGELSVTQQHGLIVCIPKENKCRNYLKNWRPITLLNTAYKIASGCIANRIKQVLDQLVSTDQTGFIEGRFIGENTRLVYDLLQFTEEEHIPGLLLLIDFEKAFDSLSWSFINKVLKFFNFGPSIINWITVLNRNACSAVSQCGHLSPFFMLGRGCRQGDPISPYLFILCAEILSIRLRNNKNIKGIKIDNVELKFSQYADDASAFLDGSKTSLEETLQELETFANISGLKTNFDKTQVVWIGAKKYSTDAIKTRWKLSWGATQFRLLGITFDVDLDIIGINYKDKIAQIKNSIKMWRRRFLTPLGKITVIKSLLLPKITHLLIALPNPDTETLNIISGIFYDFLWNGRAKIKQSVIVKQYFEGGLSMINLTAFTQALKITWLRRILQKESKWQLLIRKFVNIENAFCCGSEYTELASKKLKNKFWKDVFTALSNFQKHLKVDWDISSPYQTPIFCNKNLLVGGKCFFYKSWLDKGICYIQDLMDNECNFLDFNAFSQSTSINTNFLQYQGVIECIKKLMRKKENTGSTDKNIIGPVFPKVVQSILKQKKGSQNIYKVLNKNNVEPTGKNKWNHLYHIDEKSWEYIYLAPFKITKCTKLRWFQTCINHKILVTNKFLYQIKMIDSPNCCFCGNNEESIEHLFWHCPRTQQFIKEVTEKFQGMSISLNLTERNFILGYFPQNTSNIIQFLILVAKYYINMSKGTNKRLTFLEYKINVQSLFQSHKEIALQNNKLQIFVDAWAPFKNLFNIN